MNTHIWTYAYLELWGSVSDVMAYFLLQHTTGVVPLSLSQVPRVTQYDGRIGVKQTPVNIYVSNALTINP